MKSININILQAVSTLVTAGEITVEQLRAAIAEKRGLNMPCGASRDEHGHFYSFFVATEEENRTKARRSEDGLRIKFNLRANDVKKNQKAQAAQTPGEVLPQGAQGAPQLDAGALAAVAALLQQLQAGPQEAKQEAAKVESDFADLNEVL